VVTVFLGAVALLVWAVVPAVVNEGLKLIRRIPEFIDQLVTSEWIAYWDKQLNGSISTAADNFLTYLLDSSNWPSLVGGVLQVGLGAATGAVGFLVVVILSIYFMASIEGMKEYVSKLVSASKRERFMALTDQVTYSVGRWVMGQVTVAAIHAVVLYVFLSIVSAPYAPLLAVLAFVLAIVPLIGSVSAAVVTTLISLVSSPTLAITVGVFYLVYLQIEAYLISPRVMKRAVSVPAALVVIAALMGGTLLGILGAVIAIPMAASVLLIVREVWIPRPKDASRHQMRRQLRCLQSQTALQPPAAGDSHPIPAQKHASEHRSGSNARGPHRWLGAAVVIAGWLLQCHDQGRI
jgi:predicted PurR-regulated permease PerM